MNELLKNLKILAKDKIGLCSSELARKTYQQYQYHNVAPPHDSNNCEICKLYKESKL